MICVIAGSLVIRSKTIAVQTNVIAQLQLGQASLVQGKTLLRRAASERKLGLLDDATASFQGARLHFWQAEYDAKTSRLLDLAGLLPIAGDGVRARVNAVAGVSEMGMALADAGSRASDIDRLFVKPSSQAGSSGALLGLLRDVQPGFEPLREDFDRAASAARTVDAAVLPESQRTAFLQARATIAKTVAGIDEFEQFSPVLADILGGNGRRTYLVEQVNPSELRSGGGFLGTMSVLDFEAGKMRLRSSGSVTGFESPWRPLAGSSGYVAPPHALNFFYTNKTWWMEDSNFFPDFATNAGWAEFFSKRDQHISPDGVFALDYYAVASLLDVTGPIDLPQYGVTFTSANFVKEVERHDLLQDQVHKDLVTAAVAPLMARIAALPPDRWVALVQNLNKSVTGRHLQAYFNSPAAEAAMRKFGWSGDLNPLRTTDFLMETEDSYGGTKANQFVSRAFDLTLIRKGEMLHHHLVLRVDDRPPAITIPFGFHYHFYARFYVPAAASNLSLQAGSGNFRTKIPPWDTNPDVPPGYQLADGWVYIDVAPGQMNYAQLIVDYDTPWGAGASGSHTLYMQKQPGTIGGDLTVAWQVNGRTLRGHAKLDQDQVIRLSPDGVRVDPGQAATAALPALGF